MSKNLFLITGGGTGAKVAEALVHLCATGIGPEHVYILLIDSDTSNGNLNRTVDTIASYRRLQGWPWSVQANVKFGFLRGGEDVWLTLFSTQVHVYQITEPIDTVFGGGIQTAVASSEMHQVLDLLYDDQEQEAKCDDGFRARPNLGCLLMADHLNEKLRTKAKPFLDEMKHAASTNDSVPIIVTASVFGGTGASLLPIIRGCIERALGASRETLARFRWSAVKILPHYKPAFKKDSVDPDRYLLDTASALQYYAAVYETTEDKGRFDAMYIVGSDDPSRNRVKTVLGYSGQANPGYFEEVVAALAILHDARQPANPKRPMHVYEPDRLAWETLPYEDPQQLRENLAYLLHLAAFFLRHGNAGLHEQSAMGLALFLRNVGDEDIRMYRWYQEILNRWAEQHPTYKAAEESRRVSVLRNSASMGPQSVEEALEGAATYFGRLLLWSESALRGLENPFFEYKSGNYAGLHGTMSEIKSEEIDVQNATGGAEEIQFSGDNALIRLMRVALSALVHHHKHNTRGRLLNDPVILFDEQNGRISLNATYQQVKDTLRELELSRLVEEYTSTMITEDV